MHLSIRWLKKLEVATLDLRIPVSDHKGPYSLIELQLAALEFSSVFIPFSIHILFNVSKLVHPHCNLQVSHIIRLNYKIVRTNNTDIDVVTF